VLLFAGQPFRTCPDLRSAQSFFMPFLAVTLLWLLNSDRVRSEIRNRIAPNVIIVASVVLFGFVATRGIIDAP
jgi:hypothetical protein